MEGDSLFLFFDWFYEAPIIIFYIPHILLQF